jgi:vancomycin resistance protein YoaR
MTGVTLTSRAALHFDARRAGRGALLGFGITMAAALVVLGATVLTLGLAHGRAVMPGVQVGGVALAGLERAAAGEKLRASLPSLTAGQVSLVIDGETHAVGYAEVGRAYEIDLMLDAAFGVGRSGNPATDAVTRVRSLIHATSLPVIVRGYDPAAMGAAVGNIVAAASREPVDGVARRSADGAFVADPAIHGRRIASDQVQAAIAGAVTTSDAASVAISLTPELIAPGVSTARAEAAAAQAQALVADDLRLTVGDDQHVISAGQLADWISFGPAGAEGYGAIVDRMAVRSFVAGLVDDVAREPRNASFSLGASGGPTGVIPGVEGRQLQITESVSAIMGGLGKRAAGERLAAVPLAISVTDPALSTPAAEAALPQMELLSTWTTYYTSGPSNHYGANINIPARDIDGRMLAPGEWFSFWGSIGPITLDRGYGMGGAIIGGRTVLDGAIAGGICSTSTTIFNAAARAGLEIGDRKAHYYYISRYPVGLDATVWMSDSFTQDMTFRNDTDSPIVIRGAGGDGWVRFDLWGVPTGRTVAFSEPLVSNQSAAVTTTQVSASLAPGASRRVQEPYNGFDAVVNRTVRDASGEVIHADRWFSAYRTVNAVIEVGPTAAAPPPPADASAGSVAGAGEAPPED